MQLPENKVEKFLQEFEKLYKTGPYHHPNQTYYIKNTPKYASLMMHWDDNPKHDHILVRIDKKTLNILTPTGKVPIGNLNTEFGGLEFFDETGLLRTTGLHPAKKEVRIRQLKGLPSFQKVEPPKENYDYGF